VVIPGVLALLFQVASPAAPCGTGAQSWPTKKWQTTTPAEVGLDPDSLNSVVARARAIPGMTSLLVIRHGQIALEEYFHGGSRGEPALVASITKTVTSYLVGIALERGLIDSLNQPLIQLVPQVAPPAGRPAAAITVRQLLTMTSGLSDQWYLTKPLMLRVMRPPGTAFAYSNEAVQLLIRAISQTSHQSVLKFSQETLFKPLNIDVDKTRWLPFDTDGVADGAAGLRLTTRELGKLGLLGLRDGCWEGLQVVPATYLHEAMRKQVDAGPPEGSRRGYGFLWWIADNGAPYMAGQGGQYVVVFSELDLVAVVTAKGNAPNPDYVGQFKLISEGVPGAVRP